MGKCGRAFFLGIHDTYQYVVRGPQESSSKEACLTVLGSGTFCSVSISAPKTRRHSAILFFFFNIASISHTLFYQRIVSSTTSV